MSHESEFYRVQKTLNFKLTISYCSNLTTPIPHQFNTRKSNRTHKLINFTHCLRKLIIPDAHVQCFANVSTIICSSFISCSDKFTTKNSC